MFTRDQIEEIKKKLVAFGTKDTQLLDAHKLDGNEIVAIVQDGENRKIPLSSIIGMLSDISVTPNDDFINVSKDTTVILTLDTAVSKVDINNRKLGQVITFKDSASSWATYQFTGSSLDDWSATSLWKNITGSGESGVDELKSQVETNTSNISSLNTDVSTLQSKVDENTTSISQINNTVAGHEESIDQINTKLSEHTASISESKVAIEKNTSDIKNVSDTVDAQAARLDDVDTTLENALFKNKGYFTTLEKLNEAIPNPTVGSKAYVGTSEPYAIYIVENGVWVDSGYTGGNEIASQTNNIIISDSEEYSYDFAIADDKGNAILILQDGGIFTKNFSSSDIPDTPTISGIPEAPMDGKTYGRNNGAWNVITSNGESYLGSIEYTGQKIVFPKMNYKRLGTLPNNQQCCIIHKNLAIFVNGTKYWVTDKNNGFNVLKAGDVGVNGLHSNVGSLGTEFYNGNTIPLIYLTDWDGEKGVKVFNLSRTNYIMSCVQSINPSSELLNSDIFGRGNTDFIVDRGNGFLYSICYKEDTWREIESNKTCICKFALPRLSAGRNFTLGLSDIIEHFEVENIPTRQDCCIHNGILYIENGYMNPHYKATLRAIDLSKKEVVSKIDISKIVDGEPECLEFDEDHLLMAYGKTIYGLYF